MAQLLPSNRLQLCEHKKQELTKKSKTYPKSADLKITRKSTLTYPMRNLAQILPGVTTDVANHKNSSADWKIWD